MKTFYWLVKREFWEHRGGFFWAPVVTGGIFLVLNIMGIITAEVFGARHGGFHSGGVSGLQSVIQSMDAGDLSKVGMALDVAMYSAMALIVVVLGFVVFFYCLGALYDDRRDRSILFWKSLPISNTSTVLSKVASATVLAPVIAVAVGIVVGMLQLVIVAITLSFHGVNVWQLLVLAHPFRVMANLIGYIPMYLLWALPCVGWLLFCSSASRSKPFLWAVLIPLATALLVSWFGIMGLFDLPPTWFWSHVVPRALLSVFPGSSTLAGINMNIGDHVPGGSQLSFMDLGTTYRTLLTAQLWIGVVAGAVLIAGAAWFRRTRDEG
jgi:ABC-2 type transport system permease protein